MSISRRAFPFTFTVMAHLGKRRKREAIEGASALFINCRLTSSSMPIIIPKCSRFVINPVAAMLWRSFIHPTLHSPILMLTYTTNVVHNLVFSDPLTSNA